MVYINCIDYNIIRKGSMMFGTIKSFFDDRSFGFIIDKDGADRFFHMNDVEPDSKADICEGQFVDFEPYSNRKGLAARNVKIIAQSMDRHLSKNRVNLLKEIANWKLDAKLEDSSRYFYYQDFVKQLVNGEKCYVIGRKGTGKTAISEYLSKLYDVGIFTRKLSFKNFPFNVLYSHSDNQFTFPNQYITIWKYIILSEIAQLMLQNQNIAPLVHEELGRIYSDDLERKLANSINKWTSGEFQITLLGSGGKFGATREFTPNERSWIEKVEVLEEYIKTNIDRSTYYIIFDELDEDYKYVGEETSDTKYISLIIGLYKAVHDIKSRFPAREFNIFPIIFLRDDIFSQIRNSDRTKWTDLSIELDWNDEQLKNMLGFRLSRARDDWDSKDDTSFELAWLDLFSLEPVKSYGTKTSSFNYILQCSQLRPRDFIKFISECASSALEKRTPYITSTIVQAAEIKYSDYLRSELEDEIDSLFQEIRHILDVLTGMQKTTFILSQFEEAYRQYAVDNNIPVRSPRKILSLLFDFSIIGISTKNTKTIFKYQNKNSRFNPKGSFYIHKGLTKSLPF